jgi:hypothetical protein
MAWTGERVSPQPSLPSLSLLSLRRRAFDAIRRARVSIPMWNSIPLSRVPERLDTVARVLRRKGFGKPPPRKQSQGRTKIGS